VLPSFKFTFHSLLICSPPPVCLPPLPRPHPLLPIDCLSSTYSHSLFLA
jgi:hypothetical protein